VRFIAKAAALAKTIVAIDTGTFVIARAGLMTDRRFCLHWFHHREFVDEFPEIDASMDQIFLVDGNFITCAGGTWSTDLAIHLIAEIWGSAEASRATSLMGLERMRRASHYQAPFFDGAPRVSDPQVRGAIQTIERNCSRPPSVKELAEKANLSIRQLERRFHAAVGMKPAEFSRVIRLRFGHWLPHNSQPAIAQIAFDSGFTDQSHFTRAFARLFGATPGRQRDGKGGGEIPRRQPRQN
jgi:transcriptional regulator GlxA family with amidase domain